MWSTTGRRAEVEGLPSERRLQYGGSNSYDSSGALRFVRIWHAGYELFANNELNGLTLAGVGNGTDIDHVEVCAPPISKACLFARLRARARANICIEDASRAAKAFLLRGMAIMAPSL